MRKLSSGEEILLICCSSIGEDVSHSLNACPEPSYGAASILWNSSIQISWSTCWYHMKAGPGPVLIAMRHLVTLRHSSFYLCLCLPLFHMKLSWSPVQRCFYNKELMLNTAGYKGTFHLTRSLFYLMTINEKECARIFYIFYSQEWRI